MRLCESQKSLRLSHRDDKVTLTVLTRSQSSRWLDSSSNLEWNQAIRLAGLAVFMCYFVVTVIKRSTWRGDKLNFFLQSSHVRREDLDEIDVYFYVCTFTCDSAGPTLQLEWMPWPGMHSRIKGARYLPRLGLETRCRWLDS